MNEQEVKESIIEVYKELYGDIDGTIIATTQQNSEANSSDMSGVQLDSIQYIKFIVGIETKFNIEFEDDDLYMNSFETIDSFVDYVIKKVNAK